MRRFLKADLPERGETWLLGDEGRHLARVLRARPGDEVGLFDGRGRAVRAVVLRAERDRVLVEIAGEAEAARPAREVVLVTAVPRGDRMELLVEKAVEAGAARIVALAAGRSVRKETGENTLRRWRRAAVEAAKQCGRAVVPDVEGPVPLADALRATHGLPRLVASPGAARRLDDLLRETDPPAVALFVGPEGGFEPEETEALAASGAVPFTLGAITLRIETAATIAVHLGAR